MKKRILSIMLALALVFGLTPAFALTASAATGYALYIKGQQVTSANCSDPAGDGRFSYDPVGKVLTVSGSASYNQNVVQSEISGLKIVVTADVTLFSLGAYSGLALSADTEIVSAGGKLSIMSMQGNALTCSGSGRTVTFRGANIFAQGYTGGLVSNGANSLVFDTSTVRVDAENGKAVSGWTRGVTFSRCSVTTPAGAQVKNGAVLGSDGSDPKSVSIQIDSVDIHAIVTYDNAEENSGTWGVFSTGSTSALTVLGEAPSAYAVAYAYGYVFGIDADGDLFAAPVDALSDANYAIGYIDAGYKALSMTFDYTRGKLFALIAGDSKILVSIDPITLELEVIGELPSGLLNIAADESGVGYGVDSDGAFCSINLDTAETAVIRENNISASYIQDIAYDFATGCFYWAHCSDDTDGIYRIDKATGAAAFVGRAGKSGAELVGMFTIPSSEPGTPFSANATGVVVIPAAADIRVGDYYFVGAEVLPIFAANRNVVWASTDESVATVTQDGVVNAVGEGCATITATSEQGGFTAGCALTVLPGLGEVATGFYFEGDPAGDGWTFVDADGDGYGWQWNLATGRNVDVYEGEGSLFSESYVNGVGSLTPDNWAVSPKISLPEGLITISLRACGQDSNDYYENFAVYVGTSSNVSEMTKLGGDCVTGYYYQQFLFDATQFAGQDVYIAIRHYNCTNQYLINLDAVEIYVNDGSAPSLKKGDFDKDGVITVADALSALRIAARLAEATPEAIAIGDIDGNGAIEVNDALSILRVAAKLADESSLG